MMTQAERESGVRLPELLELEGRVAALLPKALADVHGGGTARHLGNRHRAWLRAIPRADLARAVVRATIIALSPRWEPRDDDVDPTPREGPLEVSVPEVGRTVGLHAFRTWFRGSPREADLELERLAATGKLTVRHLTGIGWLLLRVLHAAAPDLLELLSPGATARDPDGAVVALYGGKKDYRFRLYAAQRFGELVLGAQNRGPMIEEPRPWSATQRGGYKYTLAETIPLVRNAPATDADPLCPPVVYQALQALQSTAWRINRAVLAEARAAHDWTTLEGELRDQERQERRILEEATREAEHDAPLYFVHALDFRGRVYPVGTWLTPQGPDLARALLEFATGCPLDASAIATLRQYAAGIDPADDRWLARAAALELERVDQGEPSHLPVWQDASANGLQHMALLLREPRLWSHVSGAPGVADVYQTIADELTARLEASRSASAKKILAVFGGRIPRAVAKPPTMIFGYGGTETRFRERFREWLPRDLASWFASVTWEILATGVTAPAVELRDWFQSFGAAIAQRSHGKPASWHVPGTGFPAHQRLNLEPHVKRLTFEWDGRKYAVSAPVDATRRLDKADHARSLAPNVIHSLDAAHLMMTVTAFRRLFPAAPVATVHDNFGTWATHAARLGAQFHVALVHLYGGDHNPLEDLAQQFRDQVLPPARRSTRALRRFQEQLLKLSPPTQGSLQLTVPAGDVGPMIGAEDDATPEGIQAVTPAFAAAKPLKGA